MYVVPLIGYFDRMQVRENHFVQIRGGVWSGGIAKELWNKGASKKKMRRILVHFPDEDIDTD